ncbi:Arc family DNA-binding protein [Salipiger marinus]|uniref:Arc family DNA-binding protein n=1 Tax=Salipiger marinus TaxID=555512 RepID=UPI002C645A4A|nr:Arc family DNA-binding protein [Salipiger manganoxidans]MEB3419896.1 Arc family DNA-binding protein [Salipiger manganoxidans]
MPTDRAQMPTVQIALRISPSLRNRIKAAATENNRSVNSELSATLEEKYPAPEPPKTDVQRLKLLTEMIDNAMDSDSFSLEVKRAHLSVTRELMRELVARMDPADVRTALHGWEMPPKFDLFDEDDPDFEPA